MMQDAQIASQQVETEAGRTALPLRSDTIFGVCEGLGEDFGFNPLLLRVALGAGLLWNPVAVVGIYLGLGVMVAASRLLFPPARRAPAQAAPAAPAAPAEVAAVEAQQERQEERELIAA